MSIYLSKSSVFVKIATIGTIILLAIIALTLITTNKNYGVIGGIILGILISGTVFYFYANSLDKIILEKDVIILKKNIGQINIPNSHIVEVQKLGYSNLTMTYGSKGVFGFIGNTMDDSVSFVKDRRNMIRITTKNKKYILSSERLDELVNEIKTRYKNV
ncbi:hypothetical protein BZARG_1053 [Bizionia argentinensis JUB59]|uniref:Bacterial Pleckstrin homology domain-containing protein n=1 Tax=Bizionia argentinensis JUB59 TaxID=1046627 RepID=G2EEF3_9FLAO|nr:PH domain-containing protein [Bizionia argentinensis]EGV43221.1 hypothetical protein BZARG_1053 [Bizionia argentinensis JUB59]